MAASPTSRSLALMRDRGYTCAVTEHWNPFARIRQDLFGFVDVLCLSGETVVAVQTTSYGNVSSRVNKIADHANTPIVRAAGWSIVVHGWHKSKGRWVCREVDCS